MAEKAEKAVANKNEAAGITAKYFAKKAEQTKKNKLNGGDEVTISLIKKTNVRFTKDFGKHLKKGDEMEVSDQAFEIYSDAGVIEKVN